jgi:hypothetical protein
MSVDHYQSQLVACSTGGDVMSQQAAETANQYTEMFKSGQISKDEYVELMADIARTNEINKSVANVQLMEYMNVAINGLISLASMV